MQQTIQQTTANYLSNLPNDKAFYYVEDFKNSGFPPFLTRRMRLALFRELLQSVSKPQTEWSDTEDDRVAGSWQTFVNSLKNAARVSADQMEPLLEQAVTEIIHVLVQPRQQIPELLFEENETLTAGQLDKRIKWLVVYPHFGRVLTRYLQRKDKDELSRRRCEAIVRKVDEKITRNYTPFQWGEMLQPLFELTNSTVKADLLRLFFEDRQRDQLAQKFAEVDSDLTRDEFIDLLIKKQDDENDIIEENDEEIDETTSASSEAKQDEDGGEKKEKVPFEIESGSQSQFFNDDQTSEHDDEKVAKPRRKSIYERANQEAETEERDETSDEGRNEPGSDSAVDQPTEQEEASVSLNDIFNGGSDMDEDEERTIESKPSGDQTNSFSEQNDENNEVPMWQRFAEPENTGEAVQAGNSSDERAAPIKQPHLREHLQDQENYFIRALFGGSKPSYLEALENINEQDDWKAACRLVEQDIFKPNDINIYSEAAVDFTDRLQNYFLKVNN